MASKILLLDNYDSFTFNLLHYVEEVSDREVVVFRNDQISVDEADEYDEIILSPGPGLPAGSGILLPLLRQLAPTKKILGVCLGMQAMAEAFGGTLVLLNEVMHGVDRPVFIKKTNDPLFNEITSPFMAGRYHSWVVDKRTLPSVFDILADDDQGSIMAIRHKAYRICGVQFHPESILTPVGKQLIRNWLMR